MNMGFSLGEMGLSIEEEAQEEDRFILCNMKVVGIERNLGDEGIVDFEVDKSGSNI